MIRQLQMLHFLKSSKTAKSVTTIIAKHHKKYVNHRRDNLCEEAFFLYVQSEGILFSPEVANDNAAISFAVFRLKYFFKMEERNSMKWFSKKLKKIKLLLEESVKKPGLESRGFELVYYNPRAHKKENIKRFFFFGESCPFSKNARFVTGHILAWLVDCFFLERDFH